MRLQLSSIQVVASAVLLPVSQAFSIVTTNDANALASAIFGQGITILQASFSGATVSSGTGGILTSGAAVGALPNGDHYVNNGAPAILTVDFFLNPTYSGVRVELILASEEEGGSSDPIGIFITATSPYLAQPIGITPPDSVTSYPGSSPPFWIDILTSGDSEWDSALLINAEGCIDCDTDVRLAYVTTTTTLPPGTTTTTTTAEPTTNTTQDFTTTTEEPTATTQETTPTETSTEASSTFTSSEELPDTTTTTLVTSDATKDSSTIAIESTSEIITTTSLDPSTQSTTGAETIRTTDTETISTTGTETIRTSDAPIDGTTTSSGYVKTPITSSASLSSDISTQDTAVPKPDITTTAESPEDTTVQQTESSTDVNPPSSPGSAERTSSSNTITSTAGGIPTPATSTVTASSIMPANLPVIGTFRFLGCLGSPAGYPSFELIGEGPDMTTEEYTLDFADTVATGRCDILCPGDPGLFCGGVVETSFKFHRGLSHREAPPGILLTLYAQIEAISSSLTTSDVLSAVDVKTDNSLLPTGNPTIPISLSSSTRSLVDSTITVEPSVTIIQSQGRRPIIPPFPTTISFNAGNFTRTEAVVITTITYTVVDPNNPSYLTVTELCTTLRSPPCRHCQYQQPQTVEMTTIKVDCNACGHYGENKIILEVPAGAAVVAPTGGHSVHETHQVQYHEPNPYRQKPHPDESSHGQGEPAVVTKTEPKPTPVGWNRQPEPPKPTFYRRPGPASTPVALDAPIVVVSGAVAKTIEGIFMAISFMTVFVFFL
ncbi:hypothetical protein BKA60DRAFT_590705 [Fusarium oxysporum]|nr:hypothetical protein BKA60DRAFT_590705 [Fusarium oxysporum]